MSESTTTYATEGEEYRALHPAWPHECCWPDPCIHRGSLDGVKRCESPSECDWYCGPDVTEGDGVVRLDG